MSAALQQINDDLPGQLMESVLLGGDIGRMTPSDRVRYYSAVCESLKLNPLTKPFQYVVLNGKMQLYAAKDCCEQLRKRDGVTIQIVSREVVEGCYVVVARATSRDGRFDESVGAVPIENLKGENRANAMMKAETKAKRRVTLSICGLGFLDENEIESIAGAATVEITEQGEIKGMIEAPLDDAHSRAEAKREENKALPMPKPPQTDEAGKPKTVKAGWFANVMSQFAEMRAALGDADYYRILREHGKEHANEIKDRDDAKAIYKDLLLRSKDLKLFEQMKAELGAKEFAQVLGNNGFLSPAEILDRNTAKTVFDELTERLNDLRLQQQGNPAPPVDEWEEHLAETNA